MMKHQGPKIKPAEIAAAIATCALVVALVIVLPWSYGKAYQAGYDKALEVNCTEVEA